MKHLQQQAKQRLLAFLLRHGERYSGKSNWTQTHYRWLETVKFDHPVQQIVFQEYVDTVKAMTDGSKRSTNRSKVRRRIGILAGDRRIDGLARRESAHGDDDRGRNWRLEAFRQCAATDGLSGRGAQRTLQRRKQITWGITKTGNGHVRRVLVEAAWTYRYPARKTAVLQRRAERTSEAIQEIAWKAQKRMCARYRLLEARGKLKVQVMTAIARELAGFIWAIGQALPPPIANRKGVSKWMCSVSVAEWTTVGEPSTTLGGIRQRNDPRRLEQGSSPTNRLSCGNQPAHIRLINRRHAVRSATHTLHEDSED